MTGEELAALIGKAVNGSGGDYGGRRTRTPESGDGSMGNILKEFGASFTGILGHMSDFAGKAIDQTADAKDAVDTVASSLKELNPALGKMFGSLGGLIADSVTNWQSFSGQGLQMGGDAMAFRKAVAMTGMSIRDYGAALDNNKAAFTLLSGNMSMGATAFGNLSNYLTESANNQVFQRLGMNAKDVNEALEISIRMEGAKRLGAETEKERMERFLESTAKLSREMDETAKLTGMTRQEQAKTIRAAQEEVEYRAAALSFRKNNPEGEKILGGITQSAAGMGPAMERALTMSVARNGQISQKMYQDLQNTYGKEVAAQVVEIGRMANSTNKDVQAQAIASTKTLQVNAVKGLEYMADYQKRGINADSAMTQDAYKYTYTLATALQKYKDKGMGVEEAAVAASDDIKLQQQGKLIEALEYEGKKYARGEKDPRTIATDLTTEAQRQITLFGTNLNKMVDTINGKLSMSPGVQNTANAALTAMRTPFKQNINGTDVEMSPITALSTTMIKKFDESLKQAAETDAKIILKMEDVVKKLETLFGKITLKADGTNPSKGKNNNWFQSGPQLSIWAEAGNEAIVNEADASQFIMDNIGMIGNSGVNSPSMNSLIRNIPAQLSSVATAVNAKVEEAVSTASNQSDVVGSLEEISKVMQIAVSSMKEVAQNTKDTAKNIKGLGFNLA
jgi:hypothetical protein